MNTEETVIKIISEQLNVKKDEIKLTSQLVRDLGADSLDMIELIMSFEEVYGIEIPDEEADKLLTINDIVEYTRKIKK